MWRMLLFVFALFSCSGCVENPSYVDLYDIKTTSWLSGQSVVFDFRTIRGQKSADIKFSFRYTPVAKGQEFKLIVRTYNSDFRFHTDTLNVCLPRGSGDAVRSVDLVFRRSVRWATQGKHSLSLSAQSDVANIISVGVEVGNAQNL